MEQIRVLYHFVLTVMCFVCLGFSVGMCSDSDVLIKSYVSSSLPSGDLLDSAKLQVPRITHSEWNSLVLGSDVPVMVMFAVDWCAPCRPMNLILEKLEFEFTGRFEFYFLDIDEQASIAQRYSIRSVPTFIVFKAGEQKYTLVGYHSEWTLKQLINMYV